MKLFFRLWFVALLIPSALSGKLLKIDGSVDPSFNGTGFNSLPGSVQGTRVVLDKLGGIVVTGNIGGDIGVTRFNPDGTLDLDFGGAGTGFNTIPGTTEGFDLVIDQEGRIVVVGSDAGGAILVARFFANGVLDPSFGGTGTGFITIPGTGPGLVRAGIVLDSEARIVVTGVAGGLLAVARLTPDGLVDASFGGNGTGVNTIPATEFGSSLVLDSQERIVVTGAAGGDLAVARFTSDGLVDASFGGNGTGVNTIPGTTAGRDLILDVQERIIVAGEGAGLSLLIARFTPNGLIDPTFGGNGTGLNTVDIAGFDGLHGLAFDSQSRIVVVGAEGGGFFIVVARFTPDGLRDSTFGITGNGFTVFSSVNVGFDLVLDSQGRIVTTGLGPNLFVARFFGEEFTSDCALGIREKYCPLLR